MDHRSRVWVRRRLRSPAGWELANIPLQAAIWFGLLGFPVTVANSVGFALFTLLLLKEPGTGRPSRGSSRRRAAEGSASVV
ncbi:hypothetical protein ACQPW3_28405 [Actinosynnema sp. CA-248983]